MANTVITSTMLAKEALMHLENNLVMANLVYTDLRKEYVKVGATVNVRKPVKFVATDGATRSNQDVLEYYVPVVVDNRKHVSWNFSSNELTLSIDQYSKRYIQPAVAALAQKIDSDLCALYKGVPDAVGTAATTPTAFIDLAKAGQRMDENAVPKVDRYMTINPAAEWSLADGLKGVYQSEIVKGILKEAYLGRVAKFDIAGDQNILLHTKGTLTAGTALQVNAQPAEGATSIVLKDSGGVLSGTLVEGDILTFATCYAVSPIDGSIYSYLKQFVVTALATAASNLITANVYPAFKTTVDGWQTCSARPAASSATTLLGTHTANVAFHKNAFALVVSPIELPDGAAFKARESSNNLSIRVIKDYDVKDDIEIIRLDVLYGVKTIYPELACRLLG